MTVGITLGYRGTERVPVLRSDVYASEAITSSGTSQQTTMVALADMYWRIATTVDIWVRFGPNATAAAGDDWLILAGGTLEVEAVAGDECAVVNA